MWLTSDAELLMPQNDNRKADSIALPSWDCVTEVLKRKCSPEINEKA